MNADLTCTMERHGAFRVWRRCTPEAATALEELLPDPDLTLSRGEEIVSLWRGITTSKLRVRFGDRDYFLKRYNCTGWGYRLKNALRPSRAVRAWQAVELFLAHGVPTPVPLLCLEERRLRLLGRAYLLFPFVAEEGGNFLDLWPHLDDAKRRMCLELLGVMLGKMHRQGLLHGDLNWRNIVAVREDDSFRFWLVDLDGSVLASPSPARAWDDLTHFVRDMTRAQLDEGTREVFFASWRRATGWSGADAPSST